MTRVENKHHTGDDAFYLGVPGRSIVSIDKAAARRQAMAAGAGKPGRIDVSDGRNALQAPLGR